MYRKIASPLLKLAVTVGLFTLLFRPQTFWLRPDFWGEKISVGSLLHEIRSVETHGIVFWLTLAGLVRLVGIMCGVIRWRLLLDGQGLRIPFGYMVQSWFVGRFFGIFLPGTAGLDGYRLYDSARYTGEVMKSATVIAIEKLIGFISLTLLVFVTFPMGFRLLHFNEPMLLATMVVLGGFVVVSLMTLLNPRVIQVVVAAIPTPSGIRTKVNKLGASITAYGGNRGTLLLALFFGIMVHAATCFSYCCTMSAIRAQNTTLFDILFTSPLMIWGTVLGPSVGGEGIREIVFTSVLGATSGTTKAFLMAHLGWWVGDVVPFLIGLPIFVLRSRPGRAQVEAELAKTRREAAQTEELIHLTGEQVGDYREKLINCVLAGIFAGLIGGALVGLGEAGWLAHSLTGLDELGAFWWGPLVYGVPFIGVGLAVAGALAFACLLADRFPRPQVTFGLSLGGTVAVGALVIGLFRFKRDVLAGHDPTLGQALAVCGGALAAGLVIAALVLAALWLVRARRRTAIVAGLAAFILVIMGGVVASRAAAPSVVATAFQPKVEAHGPNIFLIVADACRADYLPLYSKNAEAKTPELDAFAKDAVRFENAFSQASWTKPSFATIFSGLYPGAHTATGQTSSLPPEVTTFSELLLDAGYYTKGFANNPNITKTFNFQQGFVDYVDLKPNRILGASPSASKLSVYEFLRKAWQRVRGRIPGMGMAITDFYQPAQNVTSTGIGWLDSGERPANNPLFVFLHYMDTHDPFMDWRHPGVGYARARNEHPDPNKFLEPMRAAYVTDIEHLDEYLGEFLAGLRQRGLYDDALIVFTADHGEEFYDHGGWWHGQTLYDEVTRVPLLVKLPKNQLAGTVNTSLARHIDLAPMLVEFAGAHKADAMTGAPLITPSGSFGGEGTTAVFAENDFEGNVLEAVRTPETKLIRANEDNARKLAPIELYDVMKDPKESENLAGRGDAREAQLSNEVTKMLTQIKEHAAAPSAEATISDELREQLKRVGYLGGN